jgi:uncharacterized protein YbjT (DUF2867 family)
MILVTGATGNNGGYIIDALVALGRKDVRAVMRSPQNQADKVSHFTDLGVEVVEGDLARPDSLTPAMAGVQRMLLLSPVSPNAVELEGNAIRAAQQAGVQHVVKFSMIGAGLESTVPLARWHRQSEQQLERSGMAWTHIRPNDLMGYNTALLMPSIDKDGAFYDSLGDARISMVAEQDVAAVAAKALTEPGHEEKTYVLTGSEALSFYDVAAVLSAALEKPVRYVPISRDQAREAMLAGGLPAAAVDLVTALRDYERQGHNAVLTDTVNQLLGRPALRYEEAARACRLGSVRCFTR